MELFTWKRTKIENGNMFIDIYRYKDNKTNYLKHQVVINPQEQTATFYSPDCEGCTQK